MALNFLKRKKAPKPGILLYNNLFLKDSPRCNRNRIADRKTNIPATETPHRSNSNLAQDDCNNNITKVSDQNNIHSYNINQEYQRKINIELESHTAENNWEKGKLRIEKLLSEISNSQNNGETNQYKSLTNEKMLNENTTKSEQNIEITSQIKEGSTNHNNDLIQNVEIEKEFTGPDSHPPHRNSKLPLDIKELQSVADIAKRLKGHPKTK